MASVTMVPEMRKRTPANAMMDATSEASMPKSP